MKVTGEVVMIHQQHHWFRVRFQLPGVPGDQHECFQLPVADTASARATAAAGSTTPATTTEETTTKGAYTST